jgi:hypothetical protein
MSAGVEFTGKTYYCPKCGAEIDGYMESFWKTLNGKVYSGGDRPDEETDEDEDIFFWKEVAGCVKCLDFWDAKDLRKKEVFHFR